MGDVQRIFYYHVPSAWTAFLLFFINLVASVVYLIRRNPKADAVAAVSAEVGVVFCTVVLVTGPLWARPVWGIWWTWDVRLTSTLVLWLIYVSYLFLRRFSSQQSDPGSGGGFGHLWRAGRSAGLFLHLVFPHAASPAGDRRRWLDRPAHDACTAGELGSVPVFCCAGYLVALPAGDCASAGRRGAGNGVAFVNPGVHHEFSLRCLRRNLDDPFDLSGDAWLRRYLRLRKEVEELEPK